MLIFARSLVGPRERIYFYLRTFYFITLNKTCCNGELKMKRTLMGLLIVALLVGAASADPFIGNTLRYSINIADGVDMTALGDTDVNWGTGDVTTTGAGSFGTMAISGATTGAGATYSGIVQAEHLYSTDDARIADDLSVEGDADVVGAFTAGTIASDAGVSGTTGTFTEPVTISKAIGTAPFVITSTTVVPNLNADLLDGQEGSYYGAASDVSTLQARTYLHIQTITDPIVAAVDTIVGATDINETGFTLAPGDLSAQPDVPRTLSVSPSGELTGWILFEGTNIDDEAITEYVNFSAGSALQDTTKAFKTLTQVTSAKTAGTDRTITIGQTDELGLDMTIDNDYQLMMVKFDGGIDATQTLTKDSTYVELNNIDIAGTLDGLKTIWVYLIVE